jgi:transketolase
VPDIWRKYVGRSGAVIGIDRFGESAPAADLFRYFEFAPERIVEVVTAVLARRTERSRPHHQELSGVPS